jgi:hypothetical protein
MAKIAEQAERYDGKKKKPKKKRDERQEEGNKGIHE